MSKSNRDIVIRVVDNGWAIESYGALRVSHVFNSAKQLKTFLTRWVDDTRFDHGMRVQNGDQTSPAGKAGSEIPVREPQPPEFPEKA